MQRQFITMNRNQLQKHRIRHDLQLLIATVSIFFLSPSCAFAFSTQPRQLCPTTTKKSTIGANLPGKQRIPSLLWSNQQPTADFEYQELQIQMDAMQKQGVKPSMLEPSKRDELKGYVEAILSRRLTNLKTVDSTVPLDVKLRSSLPKTKWRMAFTTQPLMAEALPKDATITLTFAGDNKVEYGLDFFQTLALKRLAAKSTYSVLEPQPNNSGAAIVQIMYDEIVTDVMGFTNVGIGFFGILKGRSTYIQTVYFDNNIWIESGVDQSGGGFGETYYNVYARDKEDDLDDDNWQR